MISIIMGVYNGASTLKEALDSIIAQTYTDWEFIICDDCSSDSTLSILEEYGKKDNRFIIIKNEYNKGLAGSLNHCLQYVHGEYLARMDADDISLPDRLEKQYQYLETHKEMDLVGTYMQGFDENGLQNVIPQRDNPTKYDIPKGNPFHHATIVMKTNVMQALKGYRVEKYTQRTEDVDLWYRFFEGGYRGTTLPEPLYLVRLDASAYKRRKLKYMLHASYIMWKGISRLKLPTRYRIYCLKPILSWLLPQEVKNKIRRKKRCRSY